MSLAKTFAVALIPTVVVFVFMPYALRGCADRSLGQSVKLEATPDVNVNIIPDGALGNIFTIENVGLHHLMAPTNMIEGDTYQFNILNKGGLLTISDLFNFSTSSTPGLKKPTSKFGAVDILSCVYFQKRLLCALAEGVTCDPMNGRGTYLNTKTFTKDPDTVLASDQPSLFTRFIAMLLGGVLGSLLGTVLFAYVGRLIAERRQRRYINEQSKKVVDEGPHRTTPKSDVS